MLDFLIKEISIIDGTGNKAFIGDIGIKANKIITKNLSDYKSKEIIDGQNKIICPGFIDVHSHDDLSVINDKKISHNINQGITTMIVGNCGFGVSPYKSAKIQMSSLYDVDEIKKSWNNFSEYFNIIENEPPSINVGVLIGHHTIRRHSLDIANKISPTKEELSLMISLVEEGMEAGCLGLSTGLVYEPGRNAETEEIISLAKHIKKYNGVYVSHMRNEADKLFNSINETANIGLKSEVKVEISHLKTVGKDYWGNSVKALEMIENYSDQGLDIHADQYPYVARSTMLKALLINGTFDENNTSSPMGKSESNEVLLCSVPGDKSLEGKTLEDIQYIYDLPTQETVKKLLSEVSDKILVAAFGMDEKDVQIIMKHPLVMIGTDGIDFGSKPHPRAWGTYPRILEHYVKNNNIISLEQAINKMTQMPAEKFNIKNRGVIKENYFADLVIIDLNNIKDNSTFTNPKNPPNGFDYIFVNGKKAIEKGKELHVFSGTTVKNNE
jgi:N-acyl-D-amino-acid deacylase|tara:strand:+ start:1787 stop:3280 length:1494 start_codon:yes stop_codon:yes gene_type:complete